MGAICLVAHPAVADCLKRSPGWIERLSRQVGGAVTLRAEGTLAMSGAYAEQA